MTFDQVQKLRTLVQWRYMTLTPHLMDSTVASRLLIEATTQTYIVAGCADEVIERLDKQFDECIAKKAKGD